MTGMDPPPPPFRLGEWRVVPADGSLTAGALCRRLEPQAMEVLLCLVAEAGQPVSKARLLARVWQGRLVSDDALTGAIAQLRRALGDDARQPRYIETLSKRGYRLRETAESGAMAGREDLYPIVGQMILEKPIIGWGPMNNQYELSIREGSRFFNRAKRDTHNVVFEVLTATGLLGTLGFGLGIALCVIAAWRGRSGPEGVLPLALVVSVLTANMSGNWIASKFLWFAFAYAIVSARRPLKSTAVQSPG